MSTMKQFGLEFIVKDQASKTLRNLNNQLQLLERNMHAVIPTAKKLNSALGGINATSSVNQINRLNGALRNYNTTVKQVNRNTPKLPTTSQSNSSGGRGPTVGESLSTGPSMKAWMGADYYRDAASHMAQSLGGAFSAMPFGDIIGTSIGSSLEGVMTSVMTGNIGPALVGMLTSGVDAAVGVYQKSSEFVHTAIYSAFEKGTQLLTGLITNYVPQMLNRDYDRTKLSAVLGDDAMAQRLSEMGTNYAKNSSLSLQDMDFILPNLTMANKATGVKNKDMDAVMQKQMDAIVRLNFKDSGQGAGVIGSLVAMQEMLSGDYISLKRRFEFSGASVDRIKEAAGTGGVQGQMEQLIKELESMGVNNGALERVRGTTKAKMEFIKESLVDFITNPATGILATILNPFQGAIDHVTNLFDKGGGLSGQFRYNENSRIMEQMTVLEATTANIQQVFGKIGEIGAKLGESFLNGFVANVDWGALWGAVSSLMDTIASYFTPTFEILANWVNTSFVPWLLRINVLLQDETVRQNILDFITELTDIADRSLELVESIIKHMPTITSMTKVVGTFVDATTLAVNDIARGLDSLSSLFSKKFTATPDWSFLPGNTKKKKSTKNKPQGKAVGMPYVPHDEYETRLHKGERVLTAQQNRQYKQGSQGISIAKIADTLVIREDNDINKIADALVKKLNESKAVYGGAY